MIFNFRLYNLPIIIACLLLSVSCINSEEIIHDYSKVKVGDQLPTFSVVSHDGFIFSNQTIADKPVIITFFYTPCIDCKILLPIIDNLYRQYPDQLHWMCISRNEGIAEISTYWYENDFLLPYSAQEDRSVYNLFAYSGVPRIYIANMNGIIIATFDDSNMPSYEQLESILLSILN